MERAFIIYRTLLKAKHTPHLGVYKALLNACIQCGEPKRVSALLDEMAKFGVELDKVTFGMVCGAASQTADTTLASSLVRLLRTTKVSLNVMDYTQIILAFTRGGQFEKALEVLGLMYSMGVQPNHVTFVCLLSACTDLETGKRLHKQLKEVGVLQTAKLKTSLLEMYSNCGSLKDAKTVFSELLVKDEFMWSAMISACRKNERPQEAIYYFQRMKKEGSKPDHITFISALSACADLSALPTGRRIHREIEKSKIPLSTPLNNSLVNLYTRCAQVQVAKSIFEGMKDRDVVSWNGMINGFALNGNGALGLEYFVRMEREGVEPNNITFVCLLNGFR